MPQIEVTLDIDANGILNVSAKDKNTGKENKITIKSDSGLTDEEIQRMVREAEENAESDKKAKELIDTRNGTESVLHSNKKDFEAQKDQLTADEVTAFETALAAVEEQLKGEDVQAINDAMSKFMETTTPVMTAKQAAEKAKAEEAEKKGETVDASFTDVDSGNKE